MQPYKELTNIKEVKLIRRASYTVGEKKDIPLLPGHFLGRILETCTWSAHGWYG